jgi:hypothetical protein
MQITYFAMPGVDGQYFNCSALRATITPASCSARWKKSNHQSVCHACEIGAQHSGKTVISRSAVSELMCARCHTGASRLVRGCLCVSCWNREAEVVKGFNAKGTPPRPHELFWGRPEGLKSKTVFVHKVAVSVVSESAVSVSKFDRVADTLEAMLSVLRKNGDAMFMRSAPYQSPLPSLFGGC